MSNNTGCLKLLYLKTNYTMVVFVCLRKLVLNFLANHDFSIALAQQDF